VKSFQTAPQKLEKLGRFLNNKKVLGAKNDLAFKVSDVQFANSLLKMECFLKVLEENGNREH
jgi:hypothetical protein